MPTVTIDQQDYELESLSDTAKSQIQMMQLVDQEIARLNVQLAMAQTARMAYANALKAALPSQLEQTLAQGETLRVG